MRRNIQRRNALLDAAIEVLAGEGARGLTFRAVDAEAGTPVGTASNYFANRDDLLMQTAERVYERWTPDEATWAAAEQGPRDKAKVTELMRDLIGRITGFRSGYLAMLELRLEATRRPELRAVLTTRVRADVDANVAYHLEQGMPGDATSVILLVLALNWLIVETLTLPELFTPEEVDELVVKAVERSLTTT
ncbi:TetR family transcriptional regulator [Micromonospora sp. KC606]|uniref:TetR/AcrR family transcriptional regulator n=1 Tax=Micromonospora sp. KC606 TaxID=2530379 RepID=UPI00105214D6|nr:TetR/AcrR family transcriptional regulator [Micromonospora sp. KC606]TDC81571.1 TetR family transcriptional regulator [Micromonospora sp. KC606]